MNKTLHGDGQPSICLIKHIAINDVRGDGSIDPRIFHLGQFSASPTCCLCQARATITQQTAVWVGPTTSLDAVTEKKGH
jgi:hypothetical protein